MKKQKITSLSENILPVLLELKEAVSLHNEKAQREYIESDSPYSREINDAITNHNELCYYTSLQLKEAFVTRPALIKDIDLDLWVSIENKTNKQLMLNGRNPYAYDSKDGMIEIHHIGQKEDSPFAELTVTEHKTQGKSSVLHDINVKSWRQTEHAENTFVAEKSKYWTMRAKNDFSVKTTDSIDPIEPRTVETKSEVADAIISTIEFLISECSIDDLSYIKDLAESYLLIKKIGSKTISDYINKTTEPDSIRCSFCNSDEYVSNGTYKTTGEIIQRYICKKCNRSFTRVNNSIISGSNLTFIDWLKLIDCLYNGYTIKKTAQICNLSCQSVQENRYKLFYALKQLDDKVSLEGNVVIDETYIEISYKGNYDIKPIQIVPRKAHKRGHETNTPGTSKNKVCIVCAMDENNNSIARVAGCGGPNATKLENALCGAIDKENIITLYTDKERALLAYAQNNDLPIVRGCLFRKGAKIIKYSQRTSEEYEANRYLQRMNSYHSRLDSFLAKFSGTSSKYLSGYLYLFAWKERNKNKDISETYQELLNELTRSDKHLITEDIVNGNYLPNPIDIEKTYHAPKFRNEEKARKIYSEYADGKTIYQIAREFNITHQAVSQYINKFRNLGMAYRTKKEILKEEKTLQPKIINPVYSELRKYEEIYQYRINWLGTTNDFIKEMMEKYNFSRQTVKNALSEMKRVYALHEEFFIYETYEYSSLEKLYQDIYKTYTETNTKLAKHKRYEIVAKEYGFTPSNISRVVNIMESSTDYFKNTKRKTSATETLNRDRSVFIDFLKWNGSRQNFCTWASEKYGLHHRYVNRIITLCLFADKDRHKYLG